MLIKSIFIGHISIIVSYIIMTIGVIKQITKIWIKRKADQISFIDVTFRFSATLFFQVGFILMNEWYLAMANFMMLLAMIIYIDLILKFSRKKSELN